MCLTMISCAVLSRLCTGRSRGLFCELAAEQLSRLVHGLAEGLQKPR